MALGAVPDVHPAKACAETLTGVWLLPIVAPEVVASGAAVLAPHLPAETAQLLLSFGYVLWGLSLSLAFALIALVLLRLALKQTAGHGLCRQQLVATGAVGHWLSGSGGLGQGCTAGLAGTALQGAPEMAQQLAGGRSGAVGCRPWWLVAASLFTPALHPPRVAFST